MRQLADTSRQFTGKAQELVSRRFSATLLLPFLRHATRTGWSEQQVAKLCARHGVHRSAIDDLTASVPREGAFKVVDEICAHSGDENLGLHLALEAEPSWMSLPGLIGMSVANLREALTVGGDYGRRLHGGAPHVSHFVDGRGQLHLMRTRSPHEPPAPRHVVEAALGAVIVLVRRVTGVPISAVQVSFSHREPVDTSGHVQLFGTRDLRFESPHIGFVFPAAVLDLRHQSADPGLLAFLRRQAEAVIERRGGADLAVSVRQSIHELLERGEEPSLERIARGLGVTGRTLQRRLLDHGTRFSSLVERARCERALELLQRPGTSLDDVAERVGLSDARSLRRTLKRHTGRTPSEARRAAKGAMTTR